MYTGIVLLYCYSSSKFGRRPHYVRAFMIQQVVNMWQVLALEALKFSIGLTGEQTNLGSSKGLKVIYVNSSATLLIWA